MASSPNQSFDHQDQASSLKLFLIFPPDQKIAEAQDLRDIIESGNVTILEDESEIPFDTQDAVAVLVRNMSYWRGVQHSRHTSLPFHLLQVLLA